MCSALIDQMKLPVCVDVNLRSSNAPMKNCKDGSDEDNCSPVNDCGCLKNQLGCNCGFS